MGGSSTVFQIQFQGILCTSHELATWLLLDVPYLEETPYNLVYHVPQQDYSIVLSISTKTLVYHIRCHRMQDLLTIGLTPPAYWITARMVAQDIFCSLERRGFQVEYGGGLLKWQA